MNTIPQDVISQLNREIEGRTIISSDSSYEEARKIWNGMIDRNPAIIIQCQDQNDVVTALQFAKMRDLEITVRGAGHNIAGNSINDDACVIDFSQMKDVKIDASKKRAYVQPGATLKDLDEATQKHGLAIPVGINSTTGIAGLTLGGGFGWLTRMHGMTVDNLISAKVVTVEGESITASDSENTDLFWALRGGGGNFGIVTEFEFQLHPVGPNVVAGLVVYPYEQAKSVLSQYREFMATAPQELNVWVVMRHAPPLPFLPEDVHGKRVVVLAICCVGDNDKAAELAEPLKSFGEPYGAQVGVMPFVDWQQAFDPLLEPGARNYWKSHNFTELSDGVLDCMIDYAGKMPSPQCEIFIGLIAGAANNVAPDAMAWGHRNTNYVMNVHGRWDDSSDDQACITWSRDFFQASKPFASSGAYVNFMTEEEGERVEDAYADNYERLVAVKRKYDPQNLLHMNQNIKP